jgi:hypothetical protein
MGDILILGIVLYSRDETITYENAQGPRMGKIV